MLIVCRYPLGIPQSTPVLTPVIQDYLPLYMKPNARITVTVDARKISYVTQSYALQPAVAATSILIEM